MEARRALGSAGERAAERFLRTRGYRILARNFRTRYGEIDLVARDGRTVVFVEVKTRRGTGYGMPEEAVTAAKRRHLILAARIYLSLSRLEEVDWRVDVIGLLCTAHGSWEVRHFPNAVEGLI